MKNDTIKVAVAELMLGYTRVQGLVVYNSASKEFNEISPAQARRLIDSGELFGVKYEKTEDGYEFHCDESFSQEDLMIKTACGKYRSMNNEIIGSSILNSIYTVVKKIEYTDQNFYEIVGTKCSRMVITEDNLRELNNISHVAGCWIDSEITLHEAIPVIEKGIPYNMNEIEVNSDIPVNKVIEKPVDKDSEVKEEPIDTDSEVKEDPVDLSDTEELKELSSEEMNEVFGEKAKPKNSNRNNSKKKKRA